MEEKRNPYLARLLAVIGLITAIVVLIVAVGAATSTDEEPTGNQQNPARQATERPTTNKKRYKVQEGDNLTIISQKTGVPIARLEQLNPELDPQALQPGQRLKLR